MSVAIDFTEIKSDLVKAENKIQKWLIEPKTLFMLIWVSSLIATPVIYTYSPSIWGLING